MWIIAWTSIAVTFWFILKQVKKTETITSWKYWLATFSLEWLGILSMVGIFYSALVLIAYWMSSMYAIDVAYYQLEQWIRFLLPISRFFDNNEGILIFTGAVSLLLLLGTSVGRMYPNVLQRVWRTYRWLPKTYVALSIAGSLTFFGASADPTVKEVIRSLQDTQKEIKGELEQAAWRNHLSLSLKIQQQYPQLLLTPQAKEIEAFHKKAQEVKQEIQEDETYTPYIHYYRWDPSEPDTDFSVNTFIVKAKIDWASQLKEFQKLEQAATTRKSKRYFETHQNALKDCSLADAKKINLQAKTYLASLEVQKDVMADAARSLLGLALDDAMRNTVGSLLERLPDENLGKQFLGFLMEKLPETLIDCSSDLLVSETIRGVPPKDIIRHTLDKGHTVFQTSQEIVKTGGNLFSARVKSAHKTLTALKQKIPAEAEKIMAGLARTSLLNQYELSNPQVDRMAKNIIDRAILSIRNKDIPAREKLKQLQTLNETEFIGGPALSDDYRKYTAVAAIEKQYLKSDSFSRKVNLLSGNLLVTESQGKLGKFRKEVYGTYQQPLIYAPTKNIGYANQEKEVRHWRNARKQYAIDAFLKGKTLTAAHWDEIFGDFLNKNELAASHFSFILTVTKNPPIKISLTNNRYVFPPEFIKLVNGNENLIANIIRYIPEFCPHTAKHPV